MSNGKETVTDRFFQAYEELLALDKTGLNQFCRDLGADKRNFCAVMRHRDRYHIRAEWLAVLVEKYGVSAGWLLTGKGWIFGE